jgi:signal transduction histidine kinase
MVAALLVGGIGFWLLRKVKRPIERLLEGTRQIATGNLGHRIRLEGRDELARVAASFNRMAVDLEGQRAALMRAQAGLEQKVRERTGELERANLTLQRLDELRRRMFADISHELRTPLTIISGEAEVTLRSRNAGIDDHRAALGRIVDLTGQVAHLVEDLMLLARADAEGLQIRRAPVAIEAVLREAAEDLRALADGHQIAFALRLPDGASHSVDADPARLAQLLLILVDNACRYTEAGGRIGVALEIRGPQAVLQVSDSGIGIPAHEAGAVFDRYFRGERARRMAPKGSGLGLHVARTIAEAHDGSLAIDSEPGRGTTVTLSLPLLRPGQDDHADPAD